ncbi:MAG: response regulator [Beijerinckiaceae bacterium]
MTEILIVDDSRTMRDMLIRALTEGGFAVTQASDGQEALEVLDESNFDLIITDINMPRLDGFGLIESIRKDNRHRFTPVVVLTTESAADKKQKARDAGASGWIVKPFEPNKLIDVVRRLAH